MSSTSSEERKKRANLFEDSRLRIRYRAGKARSAVIAFTGVGHALGSIQADDFSRTLTDGFSHIFFVTDKLRHWYNGPHLADIIKMLNSELAARRITACVTLGNSMGGFGAIALARHLVGCRAAVAFGPQSSVHPEIVPFENRWAEWRSTISEWTIPDAVTEIRPEFEYYLFAGDSDDRDVRHIHRFRNAGNVHKKIFKGGGHDVARHMKHQDLLQPAIYGILKKEFAEPETAQNQDA